MSLHAQTERHLPSLWIAALRRRYVMGHQAGFTMIELLVAIVLGLIISAAVILTLFTLTDSFNTQQTKLLNQDDARLAINQISKYIREATSSADNVTTLSNSVATAAPQNIELYADIDGDNIAEKVRYYLDGTNLRMQSSQPSLVSTPSPHYVYPAYQTNGVVVQNGIRNGSNPVFKYYYYNASGGLQQFSYTPTSVSDLQDVVAVAIDVFINENPNLAKSNVELSTLVQIRQRYSGGIAQ